MRCVVISAGVVVDVDPQPADVSLCTLVLASPAEVTPSPFALEIADAGLIGGAIVALWAFAWALRQVAGVIKSE